MKMMTATEQLIHAALEARQNAYTPYSHWAVGAALETDDGRIYRGCNIENAAFAPTNCAERTAFFSAAADGCRKFRRIAIVGGTAGEAPSTQCPPCGVCRQVMAEFCDPEAFEIITAVSENDYQIYMLKDLLPESFGPGTISAG